MNDQKSNELSEQVQIQEVPEGAAVTTQAQFLELLAAARLGYEGVKASEEGAKELVKQLKEIVTSANAEYAKISEATPKFAAAATEVEVKRTAVATHAQQIDEAQKRAADIRGELDRLLVSAKQTQAQAEGLKQSVESAKASATQADADITAAKAAVDANASAVASALAASKAASVKTKGLADISEQVDQRIKEYEARLNELNKQCAAQLEAIKSLLPGATSAGLASAFDQRRQTFLKPSTRWEVMFVTSVVVLAVIALLSLFEVYRGVPMTFQQLGVLWLSRLPVAAALIWLAMHASHNSGLAKRLEEDYGFKASVASSFQGFQEQMKNVGGLASGNEPLKELCDATLAQITNPPGRIYEKHALSVSPTSELAKAIVEAAKAAKLPIGT